MPNTGITSSDNLAIAMAIDIGMLGTGSVVPMTRAIVSHIDRIVSISDPATLKIRPSIPGVIAHFTMQSTASLMATGCIVLSPGPIIGSFLLAIFWKSLVVTGDVAL